MTGLSPDYLPSTRDPKPTRLGPNDRQDCGTEACRRWHASHGLLHVCLQMAPHWRRTQIQPLRPKGSEAA